MAETIVKTYQLNIDGIDSVEELRNAINELNEAIKKLDSTTKEYEETLSKLNQLQDKLKEAMGGVTDSFKEGKESIASAKETIKEFNEAVAETTGEEGLEGMKTKVEEVVSTNTELDASLTKEAESMKELRTQINGLKDRLVQLKSGTKEYEDTLGVLVEKQAKLSSVIADTKRSTDTAKGSYAALSAEMSALKKRWRETADEAERAELGKRIGQINSELKSLDASIGNYQRNVGNYANAMREVFGNPRKEIRALREELANLEVGSERYNQVLLQMADLTQRQRHFQDQLRFSSSNLEDIFKNTAGVIGSVAGGFSALNGMMNLFGKGNDDIQKAMLRTQSLIAIVQGMNGLAGLKDKIVGLMDGIKGFSSRFGMLNKSTKEFTAETKAAGGAAQETTGTMDAQAGVAERLSAVIDSLNEKEKETIEISKEQVAQKNAELAVLKQELAFEKDALMFAFDADGVMKSTVETETKSTKAKEEKIQALENEIAKQEDVIERIIEEGRQRKMLSGELTQEEYERMKVVDAEEKGVQSINDTIIAVEQKIAEYEKEIASLERKKEAGEELSENERLLLEYDKRQVEFRKNNVDRLKTEVKARQEQLAQDRQELALMQERTAKLKQLEVERAKLRKGQVFAIAQNKLEVWGIKSLIAAEKADAAQKKALAATYNTLAVTCRVASVAVKTVKTALISSGIGALLVIFGSAITKIVEGIGDWISGESKLNAELGIMNAKTKELEAQLKEIQTIANGFGFSSFKKASMEIEKMIEIMKAKQEEFDYAVMQGKKDTDELRDSWYEAQDAVNDALMDAEIQIEKLILDVEKADRQKGMTQLEKDLEDTNKKFQDAIDLVKTFGEQGIWSADRVAAKINSLNKALEKQTQLLTEAAQSGSTSGKTSGHTGESEYEKQRKEAKKLLEELDENAKTEEQKLRDKYEKQKKLLEKYHLDTTKLTEKYYKDLDKLMTERNKASYDKWKAHLEAELTLMQNQLKDYEYMVGSTNADAFAAMVQKGLEDEVPVMEKEIDNLVKDFEYMFGSIDSPFEELFDIQQLDEAGSRAITITQDIAESMKELGLDPTNIEDIDTMIDKWKLDKKAIDDANKELVKYKSNIKMAAYEAANDSIEVNLDRMTESVETEYEVLSTETAKFAGLFKGWYDGLSPEQQEEQFRMRYQVLETGLQQEYDLWKKAAEDETLTIEDRNTAIANLNAVVMKQNQTAAQKTIDANNLVIKSFQRVSTALSSMATNIAGIMGTVSDAIMDSANAQLNAGKITEKAYEEQFETAKAYQIAQSIISTLAGAIGVFMGITAESGGWGIAAAAIEAAAVLAAGFAQIQQIRNTKPETSGSGGGGGGGSTNAFSLPNVLTPEPQRVENLTNQSDIDALANALNDQRVYVLDSDIQAANGRSNKRRAEVSF